MCCCCGWCCGLTCCCICAACTPQTPCNTLQCLVSPRATQQRVSPTSQDPAVPLPHPHLRSSPLHPYSHLHPHPPVHGVDVALLFFLVIKVNLLAFITLEVHHTTAQHSTAPAQHSKTATATGTVLSWHCIVRTKRKARPLPAAKHSCMIVCECGASCLQRYPAARIQ